MSDERRMHCSGVFSKPLWLIRPWHLWGKLTYISLKVQICEANEEEHLAAHLYTLPLLSNVYNRSIRITVLVWTTRWICLCRRVAHPTVCVCVQSSGFFRFIYCQRLLCLRACAESLCHPKGWTRRTHVRCVLIPSKHSLHDRRVRSSLACSCTGHSRTARLPQSVFLERGYKRRKYFVKISNIIHRNEDSTNRFTGA